MQHGKRRAPATLPMDSGCAENVSRESKESDSGTVAAIGLPYTRAPANRSSRAFTDYCRQRPTLPHSFPCSTIGGIRLNFRVRNGNGCDPDPMTTGMLAAWGPTMREQLSAAHVTHLRSSQTMSKNAQLNILQTVVSREHSTQRFLRALHCRNNLWSSLTAD